MDDRVRGPDVRHDPRRRARGASARAAAGPDALQQLPGRHQDAPHGVPLAAAPCPAKPADLGFSFSPSTKDAIVIRLEKKGFRNKSHSADHNAHNHKVLCCCLLNVCPKNVAVADSI